MKVVICGGGIMGVSTAYFLAKNGIGSTIIEEKAIASGASGNAGGFLARDWCDHFEVGPLARQSFDLHMELAERFPESDYRRLDTLEVNVGDSGSKPTSKSLPSWVDGHVIRTSVLGTSQTTAQVHPRKLCEALLNAAQAEAVVSVRTARVIGFERGDRAVTGVKIRLQDGSEEVLEADSLAITMGPWSGEALKWLGLNAVISGRRAHGIVMKAQPGQAETVTGHALFSECAQTRRASISAEVYPRPDGTIYMCGMSDSKPLPSSINDVEIDMEIAEKIKFLGDRVSSVIASATVERRQACYMPMSADQIPIIGKVPKFANVYIAAGHSCWGILNGPGTGKALSDLISKGKCEWLDLQNFDPARLLA